MGSRYQPIEHYGLLGNLRTAALVAMDTLLTHNFQTFENVSLIAA